MDWCIEGQRWTACCIERQRDDQIVAQMTKRCIGWCIKVQISEQRNRDRQIGVQRDKVMDRDK